MTAKEAAQLSGRSVKWMRTHCCSWCDQTMLDALRYGCGAIGKTCDPRERAIRNNPKGETRRWVGATEIEPNARPTKTNHDMEIEKAAKEIYNNAIERAAKVVEGWWTIGTIPPDEMRRIAADIRALKEEPR